MSSLKATYRNTTTNVEKIIETPVDETKPLTDRINVLKDQINVYLTQVLEEEKDKSKSSEKVTSVEEDDIEQQKQAEAAVEDEEMSSATNTSLVMNQAVKKQKIDH